MKGLDLERLRAYLGSERELTGRLIAGGRSNLTYAVTDGEQRWVVRRPPLGHVLPTAHDMKREHRVIRRCAKAGFPVPRAGAAVRRRGGDRRAVLRHGVRGRARPTARGRRSQALGAARPCTRSCSPWSTPWSSCTPSTRRRSGSADFGRPEGFLDRQLRRWGKQLDASRNRELAGIDELHAALAARHPGRRPGAVVHGDYRLDNVLIGDDDRIKAVLDWEMSTLGDPLTDLGLMLVYAGAAAAGQGRPRGVPPGRCAGSPFAVRADRPLRGALRPRHPRSAWYTAFAGFKLAVILEGIHYRYTQGQTVGAGFDRIGELVPAHRCTGSPRSGRLN